MRFGRGWFGSRALCGAVGLEELEERDADGVSLAEALTRLGRSKPPEGGWLGRGLDAFVEVHVEQGPTLAAAGAPVGVVSGIVGMLGFEVLYTGQAGHAGTTPMRGRADALCAAAAMALALREPAKGIDGAVATIGRLNVEPGAAAVIPARVSLSVDVRAADDARLEALEAAVHSSAAHGAASAGCEVALRRLWGQRAMPMAPRVRAVLARAVKAVGAPPAQLSSGAGHDAQALAAAGVPSGMLFVRSLAGGISHCPAEETDTEAIAVAAEALTIALAELGDRTPEARPPRRVAPGGR